jgi:hypothetical protein
VREVTAASTAGPELPASLTNTASARSPSTSRHCTDEHDEKRKWLAAQAHHARAGRISLGSANTSVSFAVVTGCTMS